MFSSSNENKRRKTLDSETIVQDLLRPQDPLLRADAIFAPGHNLWPVEQLPMRVAFLSSLFYFLNQCSFHIPPEFIQYFYPPSPTGQTRFPTDLYPLECKGNLVFVDYMNVYPHIVHNLLAQKGKMTIQEIHSSTLYRDKLNTLDKHAFMVGMVQYIIENLGNKRFVPSPNDWFFVFSQGDGDCGSVTIEELPLLNRCKMVKIRVPCHWNGQPCHTMAPPFNKNEVDDYMLLYTVMYFDNFRLRTEDAIRQLKNLPEENDPYRDLFIEFLENFLQHQKLFIFSNDNYDWSHPNFKARITKFRDWPGFSIGKAPAPAPPARGSSRRKKYGGTSKKR